MSTQNPCTIPSATLNAPRCARKQFHPIPVTFLLGIVMVVSLAGRLTALATTAGTVDAVFSFSANNFFVDPFQPYVYASSDASLKVINSTTLAVAQSISLPATGYGMTMSADGNKLYIAGGSSQSIFVVDTHSWSLLPSLSVADSPSDLAMGLSNRLFVLGGSISQIDATTGASTGPNVPVYFTYGGALRITPDRKTLFYADFGLSPGSLYKFDVSSTTPALVWQNGMDIGENGEGLALSHDGSMVAYVCGYGYQGYQIPNFRTSDMSLLGVFPTGAYPNCLAYSPDDKYAYAQRWPYPTAVYIYDTSSYAMVGQFPVAGQSFVMTTDQSGQHLYIAYGQVEVYDTGRSIVTNQPPVCRIGGPYTAECRGAATTVQLDGSASSDPDGDALTFSWSSDCPDATFDNPNSPKPVLTINSTAAQSCTVTLVVSDGQLAATNQAPVVVVDTTPPNLSQVTANPSTLWPPDHKMVPVTVTAVATDTCDPAPVYWIASVISSDPAGGPGTARQPDFQVTGAHTVLLRAERSDARAGRTYWLAVEAADASGNVTTNTAVVAVPGAGN